MFGSDTASPGTVAGADVCGVEEPRCVGRDALREVPDVECAPVLDADADGLLCRSTCFDDTDELADDESDPDGADGSADATP